MTKEVLVSIQGLQFSEREVKEAATDEELDSIQTICLGEYYYKNGTHFVLYEELLEECSEPIKNRIKFKDREFSLTKKGPINVQMLFAEGKKTMTDYGTPFGNILVAFDTKRICIEEDQNAMRVHINYELEANYQFIAECTIQIEIKSRVGE